MKRGVWESASSTCRNTTSSSCSWRTASSSCAPRGQTGQWLSSKSTLTDWKRWGVNHELTSWESRVHSALLWSRLPSYWILYAVVWMTDVLLSHWTCCSCMLWFWFLIVWRDNFILVSSWTHQPSGFLINHLTSNWYWNRQKWYYITHVKCWFRSFFFGTIRTDLDGLEIQTIYSNL